MNKRYKAYFRLNFLSIFLMAISFISVTFAWFAYSGLAKVQTEVDVSAWYIELTQDDKKLTNDVVITLTDIYPGMKMENEKVNIKNLGDSDAEIKYEIISARILDDTYLIDDFTSEEIEDILSHEYPFGINLSLSKSYAKSKSGESEFEVSVSWPLDSDNDVVDSEWGTKAYNFQKSEEAKNGEIRPSIQVVISISAEQYLQTETSSDMRYNLGDEILYDPVANQKCSSLFDNCIKTYVLDLNNTLKDNSVKLLINPFSDYEDGTFDEYEDFFDNITSGWTVNRRGLTIRDILHVISSDVSNSYLVRENISDSIIGFLKYDNRVIDQLKNIPKYNGYYRIMFNKFSFLSSTDCYWIQDDYSVDKVFAIENIDNKYIKVFGNDKNNSCKVIPVIEVLKSNLE